MKLTTGTLEHLRWMHDLRNRGSRIRLVRLLHQENARRHDDLVQRGFIENRGGCNEDWHVTASGRRALRARP